MSDSEIIIEQLTNDVILEQAPSTTVELETIFAQVIIEIDETVVVIESVGVQGPPGPAGGHEVFTQVSPASDWFWNHDRGYPLNVQLYNDDWEQVFTRVESTDNQVVVRWNSPMTGYVVTS